MGISLFVPLCPASLILLLISVNFRLGLLKVLQASIRVFKWQNKEYPSWCEWFDLGIGESIMKCCCSVDHTRCPCSSWAFVPLLQKQEGAPWPELGRRTVVFGELMCVGVNAAPSLSCAPTSPFMKNKYKTKGFQPPPRGLKNPTWLLNSVLFPKVSWFLHHSVLWFVGEPRTLCCIYEDNFVWMDCVWHPCCVIFALVIREVYVLITVLT